LELTERIREVETGMKNTLSKNKYQKLINFYHSANYERLLKDAAHYLKNPPADSRLIDLAGFACIRMGRYSEAVPYYEQLIKIDPASEYGYANLAIALKKLGHIERSRSLYNKALGINPNNSDTLNNLGNLYLSSGENQKAKQYYLKALKYRSDFAEAHNNLGIVYKNLGELSNARERFIKAIQLKPGYSEAYTQLGVTYKAAFEPILAIQSFDKALELNPENHLAKAHKLEQKALTCDWEEKLLPPDVQPEADFEIDVSPFGMLYFDDDPKNQKQRSRNYGLRFSRHNESNSKTNLHHKKEGRKIHIAYFSGEFHQHPVMHLMAPTFTLHDRGSFEVSAFSYGQDVNDPTHKKLQKSFDRFFDVRNYSDRKIAEFSNSLSVDIAIDLSGYTRNGRPGIFAYRAAQTQINYLGYPGTMGVGFYDYIIADKNLIPTCAQSNFTEEVLYLEPGYQLSDDSRPQFDYIVSRQKLGVRVDSFIFISFNNPVKITPELFAVWARILKNVRNSFLWLVKSNTWAEKNLKKEAKKLGLDDNQLVFWEHCEYREYLMRLSAADLFLDTLCFNAGATANDALWCGVPLITIMGQSYHSRMSGSLLAAIQMEELIADNLGNYEDLAIRLGCDQAYLRAIKTRLIRNKNDSKLFDTSIMVSELERTYRKILT